MPWLPIMSLRAWTPLLEKVWKVPLTKMITESNIETYTYKYESFLTIRCSFYVSELLKQEQKSFVHREIRYLFREIFAKIWDKVLILRCLKFWSVNSCSCVACFSKAPGISCARKTIFIYLYRKTENCIRLKLFVGRESLFILRICE